MNFKLKASLKLRVQLALANITICFHPVTDIQMTGVIMFSAAEPLVDAYNAANTGDTLNLSGGSFSLPALFNKGLINFGAGYYLENAPLAYGVWLQPIPAM